MFSYEFCEIFKNTFFTEHLQTAASVAHWVKVLHSRLEGSWLKFQKKFSQALGTNLPMRFLVSNGVTLIRFKRLSPYKRSKIGFGQPNNCGKSDRNFAFLIQNKEANQKNYSKQFSIQK